MTGPQLKALRRRLGLTQGEMAAKLGIGKATLKRWEKLPVLRKPAALAVDTLRRGLA